MSCSGTPLRPAPLRDEGNRLGSVAMLHSAKLWPYQSWRQARLGIGHHPPSRVTAACRSEGKYMAPDDKEDPNSTDGQWTMEPASLPGLCLYPQSVELAASLEGLVRGVQQGDPFAPVTVIGPSTYSNLTLRHTLARSGFANVRFMVFSRLAEYLGAPLLAAQGKRPLTPILESASVRAVTAQTTGILSGVRSHPSTIRSVRNAFRQLRQEPSVQLDALRGQDQLRRELVELYRTFRQQTREFYDPEDLSAAAAAAVRSRSAPGLDDLGLILVFQPRRISLAQRSLLEALAQWRRCSVILGLTGDDEADLPIDGLALELSPFLGQPQRRIPDSGSRPPVFSAPGRELLIAPDPHEEVRWVIRHLVQRAEQGTPLRRMAVLYGPQSPYTTLAREELELSGIPVTGPNPSPLGKTAVGRTLTALIRLSSLDFPRDIVMSWVKGCPVRPFSENKPDGFSPSNWDAISRKAGIVGGMEQWKERLERYAWEQERLSHTREEKGEISEARARLMRAEAGTAGELRQFIVTLAEDLSPPGEGSSWEAFSGWARRLVDRYLDDSQIPDLELAALERTRDILSELAAADEVSSSPTLSVFQEALHEALETSVGHSGVTGQGVFVGPIAAAAGMSFDVVHLVGMIEGAVPPPVRDDPLLPEASLTGPGRSRRQERLAQERYTFLSALASAPEVTLSFPRASPPGHRGHFPSRWFLEQATALEGAVVHTSNLWSLGDRPWLTIVTSMEESLASMPGAADPHEYDLESFWRWNSSGRELQSHPLAHSVHLGKALSRGRTHYGSRNFTRWDGNLSGVAQGSAWSQRLGTSALSPTSLERWASCPFSYFLGQVLGISSLDTPEEIYTLSAMDKGNLVHKILEEFIAKVMVEGSLPRPGEEWSVEHREILNRVAAAAFSEAESRGITGKPLLWRLDQDDIFQDLDSFLEADADLRRQYGLSPGYLEARFGMGGEDSWPAAEWRLADGSSIRFRGMIDRVDTDATRQKALVLDYKSGSAGSYSGLKKDPIDQGKRLQLAVYSLAAQNALGPEASVQAAYWFVSSRGGFERIPSEPLEISAEEVRQRVAEGVSTISSGIRGGLFPANPGPPDGMGDFQNCRYCDFKSLCPSRRDILWERKKGHPLLTSYLELSEGE